MVKRTSDWKQPDVGTSEGKDLPIANIQTSTLDQWPSSETQNSNKRWMLHLRPNYWDNRSSLVLLPLRARGTVWFHICSALGHPLSATERSVICWWRRLRSAYHGTACKGFDSLFTLVPWQIWKERNAGCFRDAASSVMDILLIIKTEAERWMLAAGARNPEGLLSGE